MQKVLKQNLHKIVIYENKPRPAARDRSQSTASEGCKIFNNYQYYNQHDMSTISRYVYYQSQSARYVYNQIHNQHDMWICIACLVSYLASN